MRIETSRTPVDIAQLAIVARHLLDAPTLCAIATVSPHNRPRINTASFAWSDSCDLAWLSESAAQHSQIVRANGVVAIAVYDSHQVWGHADRDIQLFGRASEFNGVPARNAQALYAQRVIRCAQTDQSADRFYRCRPQRMKLFDEPTFGAGAFVVARIR
jgi:hypothetical protein